MSDESEQPDPAAVFGCALSLWQACWKPPKASEHVNLSECYNGGDEFMRVVMRVATRFETWASLHIAFDELDDVWPYMMEDRFGAACIAVMGVMNLAEFSDSDCLWVALQLRLPCKVDILALSRRDTYASFPTVSTLAEIERAIEALPAPEVDALAAWLANRRQKAAVVLPVDKWLERACGASTTGVTTHDVLALTRDEP